MRKIVITISFSFLLLSLVLEKLAPVLFSYAKSKYELSEGMGENKTKETKEEKKNGKDFIHDDQVHFTSAASLTSFFSTVVQLRRAPYLPFITPPPDRS